MILFAITDKTDSKIIKSHSNKNKLKMERCSYGKILQTEDNSLNTQIDGFLTLAETRANLKNIHEDWKSLLNEFFN